MIRYRDLTEEQKEVVCNGCGPKGGIIPVPEFFCHASCDHHDFNYWLGCTEDDRRKADQQFFNEMQKDAGDDPHKQLIAFTYWMAVRLFGHLCFHYADCQRDENDLAKFMEDAKNERLRSEGEDRSFDLPNPYSPCSDVSDN